MGLWNRVGEPQRAAPLLGALMLVAASVHAADEPRVITPTPSSFETLSRFTELLDAFQKNYVQPSRVNTEWYTTEALRAFVRSIDPEADLLTPEEVMSAGKSNAVPADIGLTLVIREGIPTVVSPRDGSPAQRAGLLAGDQIVAIDNSSTLLARRSEVERLLAGPLDSEVSLRVVDPTSGSVRDLHLHRAAHGSSPMTTLRMLDKGVAYYRLAEFSKDTADSVRTAMILARSEHVAGIILDLRDNPGGMFLAVLPVASIFLPKGDEIASLDYATPALRTKFISDEGTRVTTPIVLLVNGGTAAEAEVFAAALQDNNRAQIVGSKTFGRGFFAMSTRLADGLVLVMPTAYYMRPSKQILQDKGLVPDAIVELPRETERSLALAGFGTFDWKNAKAEVLAADLPLAKAFSLLAK